MSEMKEKFIRVPVVDDRTHFIMAYEDVTEDEARFIAAFRLGSEETQESIKKILNIA